MRLLDGSNWGSRRALGSACQELSNGWTTLQFLARDRQAPTPLGGERDPSAARNSREYILQDPDPFLRVVQLALHPQSLVAHAIIAMMNWSVAGSIGRHPGASRMPFQDAHPRDFMQRSQRCIVGRHGGRASLSIDSDSIRKLAAP